MASKASFVGMIAGLMLLGLAGWIVITTPASIVENGKQAMQRRLMTAEEYAALHGSYATECGLLHGVCMTTQGEPCTTCDATSGTAGTVTMPGFPGGFPEGTAMYPAAAPAGSMAGFGAIATAMKAASASNVLLVILWVVFAVMLKSHVADEIVAKKGTLKEGPEPSNQDDFNNGIFGCFNDKWVCMQGLCCPLARMAATNEIAGVMGYWQTVGIYFITILCCSSCMVPSCVTVYFRKELKSIMNIEDNTFHDILIACCIPSLAICQQGNGVDYAAGFELTGCCEYEWLDGSESSE